MDMWMIIVLLLLLVALLGIWYVTIYNKFQTLNIKINEVETSINLLLREEVDLLLRIAKLVKTKTKSKEDFFKELSSIDDKTPIFKLDTLLNNAVNETYSLKEQYPVLVSNSTYINLERDVIDIEDQLDGMRKYYNDNVTKYNFLLKKLPSNIVGKISKFQNKDFYDGNKVE